MSVYPTGLTNYFESSVDAGATPTKLLDGPLALKSFACSVRTTNSNTGGLVWGSFSNRFSFSLPLNGIRVTDSLQISIEATGTMTNLTAEGISVIYQR